MRTNTRTPAMTTHEGGTAKKITSMQQLERSLMACLLWEDNFYESGEDAASRMHATIAKIADTGGPDVGHEIAAMAVGARTSGLRHAPLWLLVGALKNPNTRRGISPRTIAKVCNRPDQMGEMLALYWKEGKVPLAKALKVGLRDAFESFSVESLRKYNSSKAGISLRDVMRIVHPVPPSEEHKVAYAQIAKVELGSADTWEVALSAGQDKHTTWTRLMDERKLGIIATLRNLRGMGEAGVAEAEIRRYLMSFDRSACQKVWYYQYLAAAKAAPAFEDVLEQMMFSSLEAERKLGGHTAILVDMSGSMGAKLSSKSTMTRLDAAMATAMGLREVCEQVSIIPFANTHKTVRPRRGFALRDEIRGSGIAGGTYLGAACKYAFDIEGVSRVVALTDEQAHDPIPDPPENIKGYMLNLGTYKNGVGYGPWTSITGFSTMALNYILRHDNSD